MEIWESILVSIIISLALPIAFFVFWVCKLREEKGLQSEGAIRTRPPKILSGFFLGFGLFVLCGGIAALVYCCITDSERTTWTLVVVLSACVAGFSSLGFFGYAHVRFNYVVSDDEGVMAYRLLKKEKVLPLRRNRLFSRHYKLRRYG